MKRISLIIILFINNALANDRVDYFLATYSSPPYQYLENRIIKGITVSTVQCIFHKLNKKTSLEFYPLKRSLLELEKNNISGVFPVNDDEKTNINTSSPISIEKWYWLTNFPLTEENKSKTLNKSLIGTVNGSSAHDWLLKNKLTVSVTVTTREQLLNMFLAGRVDAIIIDDNEAYRDVTFHQMIQSVEHYWHFIKYESHHFAFSDNVISKNSQIIDQFNDNISSCNPLSLKLSYNEKQLLVTYLTPYLSTLSNFLRNENNTLKLGDVFTKQEIENIDNRWVNEAKKQKGTLYEFINDSVLSSFLSQLQNNSQGTITEIIAIDNDGYTMGLSTVTTDLYQGDEPQFLNTFPGGVGTLYISDIKYDASTQNFQSQVSFAMDAEHISKNITRSFTEKTHEDVNENETTKKNASVAVVTFGVNVEKLIQSSNNNVMSVVGKQL